MEDAGEPSSPSSSRSSSHEETQDDVHTTTRARRMRSGFSDSIPTDNLVASLEIEDEASPRGVLDDRSISLDSEASNASTSSRESTQVQWYGATKVRGFLRNLKKGPPAVKFQSMSPLKSVPKLTRRKSRRIREEFVPGLNTDLETELRSFKQPSWRTFSLSELMDATNNFSHENLIGEGGCAEVYKGKLSDGEWVAIKRLTRGNPEEMTADFLSELGIIVHIDHPNIAKLIGYGVEGGMHIILHLSPHGSLASILYTCAEKLDWPIRHKVAVGTAKGLTYLHGECQRRIIHKDVKASNILLSEDYEPLISDFGMAKWLPGQGSQQIVSSIEGTFGYLPPEYFMHGIVDEKTDVYAYGVLLLELITGRKALDGSQQSLVMWAKPLLVKNNIEQLIDPLLARGSYDREQMELMILVASMCIHQSSADRPDMNEVVKILEGDEESVKGAKLRQQPIHQRTYSEELNAADDYNATKYLTDLDRYMQVVMDQSDNDDQDQDQDHDHDHDNSSSTSSSDDQHSPPPNEDKLNLQLQEKPIKVQQTTGLTNN